MVLPSLKRPRLIVPLNRRAAATAVRRYGEPRSMRSRLGTRGLSLLLRSGVGGLMLRDRVRLEVPVGTPTIESYLSERLGREIKVSMYLGAPRANRKPVLQLLTPKGGAVGVAKLGVSPLAQQLVRAERDALVQLGEAHLVHLTVPPVLFDGAWRGIAVLVLGPLPVDEPRISISPARFASAISEIGGLEGTSRTPFIESGYRQSLHVRIAGADASEEREALLAALARMEARVGEICLTYGAWHGDWTPWNMANTRNGLLVWDWERFSTAVPFGFDAMHYRLQSRAIPGGIEPFRAARECVTQASEILAPFAIDGGEARLTALAYLVELTTRHLVDRQAAAGGRLGVAGSWLIPALEAEVGAL
jgi:hypothetical protein